MLIAKATSKHAVNNTEAMIKLLNNRGLPLKTITFDNGREFAGHEVVSDALDVELYFAHPHGP